VTCGKGGTDAGAIHAEVSVALVAQAARVSLTVTPPGSSQDLTRDPSDPSGNTFTGTLTLVTGTYSLTATVYDSNSNIVATANAPSVTITKGNTTNVVLTALDKTGPPPPMDHSPVITSFVVQATAQVGDQQPVSATAMDPDGNSMAFQWSANPTGCVTFANATASSTTITAVTQGTCGITFTVTANGKMATKTANLAIGPATGTLGVTVTYIPNPRIDSIALSTGGTTLCSILRTGVDATCLTPAQKGQQYTVSIGFDPIPDGAITLQDSCNGALTPPTLSTLSTGSSTASWTAPANSGTVSLVCLLTVTITRPVTPPSVSDTLMIAVVVPP
jgi:hypothetical protein